MHLTAYHMGWSGAWCENEYFVRVLRCPEYCVATLWLCDCRRAAYIRTARPNRVLILVPIFYFHSKRYARHYVSPYYHLTSFSAERTIMSPRGYAKRLRNVVFFNTPFVFLRDKLPRQQRRISSERFEAFYKTFLVFLCHGRS